MATLDDIKIAKQRWSRSLPEDLMEKSQSEPGCAAEEGRAAAGKEAGACRRLPPGSPGPARAPGHLPAFDSPAGDSRRGRAPLPA